MRRSPVPFLAGICCLFLSGPLLPPTPLSAQDAPPAAAPETTRPADERRPLDVQRRASVGERSFIRASAKLEMAILVAPEENNRLIPHRRGDVTLEVELTAVEEVRAVDENGRPRELLYRVARLVRKDGLGQSRHMMGGGDAIFVRLVEGESHIDAAEGTLSAQEKAALGMMIAVGEEDEGELDALFAASGSRRPGERWGLPLAILVEELGEAGFDLAPGKVRAAGDYLENGELNDEPVADVAFTVQADDAVPRGMTEALEQTVGPGSLGLEYRAKIPLASGQPRLEDYVVRFQSTGFDLVAAKRPRIHLASFRWTVHRERRPLDGP